MGMQILKIVSSLHPLLVCLAVASGVGIAVQSDRMSLAHRYGIVEEHCQKAVAVGLGRGKALAQEMQHVLASDQRKVRALLPWCQTGVSDCCTGPCINSGSTSFWDLNAGGHKKCNDPSDPRCFQCSCTRRTYSANGCPPAAYTGDISVNKWGCN